MSEKKYLGVAVPATSYSHRATVAELRAWLAQFQPGDEVFIGGTPVSGYIEAGERVFALYDEEETDEEET